MRNKWSKANLLRYLSLSMGLLSIFTALLRGTRTGQQILQLFSDDVKAGTTRILSSVIHHQSLTAGASVTTDDDVSRIQILTKAKGLEAATHDTQLTDNLTTSTTDITIVRPDKIPVQVFQNAMSDGGIAFTFFATEHANVEDIGTLLSPLHQCTNHMDAGGPEDPGYCKVHNQLGRRVRKLDEISPHDRLYLVPHDRLFIFPAVSLGHKFELPHITTPKGDTVMLETLSDSPKVFKLYNFMDDAEAEEIVKEALSIKQAAFMLKRSSTEAGGHTTIDRTRTSENAFVTASRTAMAIKRRVFDLLGIEHYNEHWADGLQVLRYNVSTAYNSHLDYIEEITSGEHDFKSGAYGTNRFATVVLYFNDVEDGGETAFNKATVVGKPPVQDVVNALRQEKGELMESLGIKQGSWEERLTAECSVGLAVKPRKGDAVLFYSQLPGGEVDRMSEHAACPVLVGTKWAANLWVWNGPRQGYTKKDPVTGRMIEMEDRPAKQGSQVDASGEFPILATFVNAQDGPPANLFFNDKLWDTLEPGKAVKVKSFVGHEWSVRHAETDDVLQHWKIDKRLALQTFKVPSQS